MVGRTQPIRKADRERFERLKKLPCICCMLSGKINPCGPTEIHHLLSGGRRIGHQATIPLGPWHHRVLVALNYHLSGMTDLWGPSLAHGSKPFHARYGPDSLLL